VTVDGGENKYGYTGSGLTGVFLFLRSGVTIRNLTIDGPNIGILFWSSSNNKLIDNVIGPSFAAPYGRGIYYLGMGSSSNSDNLILGNHISQKYIGMYLPGASGNILGKNTLSDNTTGIILSGNFIRVYNNNFEWNQTHVRVTSGSYNLFNIPKPFGGNYWSDWTTPDYDGDGFVDYPYVFSGGQDNLPWTRANGWLATSPTWPEGSTLSRAYVSLTKLILRWTPAQHDDGIAVYRLYKDDALVGIVAGTETTYTVYGLYPDTEYTFKVEACDADWNCTTDGPATTIRTLTTGKATTQIINEVESMNLRVGIESSLDAKLDAAYQAIGDISEKNDVAAINALQAFINATEAQRGQKIPEADADALIAAVQEIIDVLSGT
jgi:parallel beta-helix repeat protein